MKKRILTAFIVAIMAVGMVIPTAFAARIGTLNYTVNSTSINLNENGAGSFTITIPGPAQAYNGVEFTLKLPDDSRISSVGHDLPYADTAYPQELASEKGTYLFSFNAINKDGLTTPLTGSLMCTVNVEYKGSTPVTLTIQSIEQYFIVGHVLDRLISDATTAITLTPYSAAASNDISSTDSSVSPGTLPGEELPEGELPLSGIFPFEDVIESNWFYKDVYYMWEHSLMNGTSATLFSPNETLTRGMVVTVLYRMLGSPDVSVLEMPFTDVGEDAWYYNAVKWAADNGIALGIGGGAFAPNVNVTREQMAAFLYRYAEFTETELPGDVEYEGFADQADISDFAVKYVEALFKADIIRGKENNRFDPKGTATRAEYAAVLHRFIEM